MATVVYKGGMQFLQRRCLVKHVIQHKVALYSFAFPCHRTKVYRAELVIACRRPVLGLVYVQRRHAGDRLGEDRLVVPPEPAQHGIVYASRDAEKELPVKSGV
jgi:hypothetical protein